MNFTFNYSVMGLEAAVDAVCDGKRSEVRVFKRPEIPGGPAHVCFAGSGSITPAKQAAAIAHMLYVGSQIAEAFDVINLPVTSLGRVTFQHDARTGLNIEVTRDERDSLDQARVFNELLALLSTVTTQSPETLIRTLKADSWQNLRQLPEAIFQNLLKKGAPESYAHNL